MAIGDMHTDKSTQEGSLLAGVSWVCIQERPFRGCVHVEGFHGRLRTGSDMLTILRMPLERPSLRWVAGWDPRYRIRLIAQTLELRAHLLWHRVCPVSVANMVEELSAADLKGIALASIPIVVCYPC